MLVKEVQATFGLSMNAVANMCDDAGVTAWGFDVCYKSFVRRSSVPPPG